MIDWGQINILGCDIKFQWVPQRQTARKKQKYLETTNKKVDPIWVGDGV